jgi:hypothetical protein
MNDRPDDGQADRPDRSAGLCATCIHARVITSDRGSRFVMCALSKTDDRFARYPGLPVLGCRGYQRVGESQAHET